MKKRWILFLAALFLAVSAVSCAQEEKQPEGYRLYFLVERFSTYGSALGTEVWSGTGEPTAWELMTALFDGPTQPELLNPFPKGVTIRNLETDGETGMMHLALSEQYSGLSDMAQTLADACIVLTACQIPGVDAVELSVDGFWTTRPVTRILRAEEFETGTLLP